MKKIWLSPIILLSPFFLKAQCISGNCDTGVGTFTYSNGSYNGTFIKGLRNGMGIYRFKDGCVYIGTWIDGIKNGKGTFWWPNGTMAEGDFINDALTGYVKKTYNTSDHYEGMMINGEMEGFGTYFYSSGEIYVGGFRNGYRNSYGVLKSVDGEIYMGSFKNGNKQGRGITTDKTGKQIAQYWWNDKIVSEAEYFKFDTNETARIREESLKEINTTPNVAIGGIINKYGAQTSASTTLAEILADNSTVPGAKSLEDKSIKTIKK
jgi:hypothetical protein